MSIVVVKTFTCVCEGPCGTTLEVKAHKPPEGWLQVQVKQQHHPSGESEIIGTATYCPKCMEKFQAILKRAGYSFSEGKPVVVEDNSGNK